MQIVDFLNRKTIGKVSPHPTLQRRKIFLGRRGSRLIANHDEIAIEISKLGFESLYLEDLSVEEQILLFKDIEILIAPHGAALTNLVFCKDNINVFELFPPSYINPLYYQLSSIKNINYNYYVSKFGLNNGNFHVPLDIIVSYIKNIN